MVIVEPEKDPQARGDPYRTLFVARLSYEVKETDLEREFGRFGPIERVRTPHRESLCLNFHKVSDKFPSDSHRQRYRFTQGCQKAEQRIRIYRL